MLAIDGLSITGLGPPGAAAPANTPAEAEGAAFAVALANAEAALTERPVLDAPRVWIPARLAEGLPALTHASVDTVVAAEAEATLLEVLAAGIGDPAPPGTPATDATGRPDRTSEADPETSEQDPSALAIAGSVAVVVPMAVAPVATPALTGPVATSTSTTTPAVGAPSHADQPAEAHASDLPVQSAPGEAGRAPSAPQARVEAAEPRGAAARGPNADLDRARGGQPEDRLGELIRDLPVAERSAVASAWNRAGGRFDLETPPVEVPPVGAPPVEPPPIDAPPVDAPRVDAVRAAAPQIDVPPTGVPLAASYDASVETSVEPVAAASTAVAPVVTSAPSRMAAQGAESDAGAGSGPQAEIDGVARLDGSAGDEPQRAAFTVNPASTHRADVNVEALPVATTPVVAGDPGNLEALRTRLADSVLAATQRDDGSIRLVLSPPELGHLDIRVARSDGGLRVDVTAATAEAADLIQQALPALVASLEARSLRVDHAEVRHTSTLGGAASDGGTQSRQPGERGPDGQPAWTRPDWSEAARLGGADARSERPPAVEQLLDLVA